MNKSIERVREKIKNRYRDNNKGKVGNSREQGNNANSPLQALIQEDSRFRNQYFLDDVRYVLTSLDEPLNLASFQKYKGMIDWTKLAENLRNPENRIHTAICHIKDQEGRICMSDGVACSVGHDLRGRTKDEALKTLPKHYEFQGWF